MALSRRPFTATPVDRRTRFGGTPRDLAKSIVT